MKPVFTKYKRTQTMELRPWIPGEDMSGISVSLPDKQAGSPKPGDMIARNPRNYADQWLVAAAYFAENYEATDPLDAEIDPKVLGQVVVEVFAREPNPTLMDIAKAYQSRRRA